MRGTISGWASAMLISASPRTQARRDVGRQERRLGVFLLEVFEDRERLEQLGRAVGQRRHHHLRIDRAVLRRELVATLQMEEHILALQPLQVERDAHAETRLRAIIGIELHRRPFARITAAFSPHPHPIATILLLEPQKSRRSWPRRRRAVARSYASTDRG